MKEFTSIKVLDKFAFLFNKMGIDYPNMRKILQMKLTLDSRRSTIMERNKGLDEDEEKSFFQKYWGYGLLGVFNAVVISLGNTPFIGTSIYFTVLMFLLVSTLISDFSNIILDLKDKILLVSKPIDKKTISMARFIHVFIYIISLMIFLGGPGLVFIGWKYGIEYSALMIVMLVVISCLCMFSTSLLYTLLLKKFDGEKLKDVINGFQIGISIALSVGYQIAARVFDVVEMNLVFTPKWWAYLIPPVWFGAPFEILYSRSFEPVYLSLTLIGIIVSGVSLIIHFKVIVPNFETYLSKLETGGERFVKKPIREKINNILIKLMSVNKMERTFIKFTQIMLTKERSTKLRIYPSIALGVALPVILMIFNVIDREAISESLSTIDNHKNVLYFYLTMAMVCPIVSLIKYSDSYKGAWIYEVLPIENKKIVIEGAFKGTLLSYSIPVFAFISFVSILIFGFDIILDLFMMFMSSIMAMLALVSAGISKKYPFSEKFVQSENQADGFQAVLIGFSVVGIFSGLHMYLIDNRMAIAIITNIAIIINYVSWRKLFRTNNKKTSKILSKELI